jgi:hypothetical protein
MIPAPEIRGRLLQVFTEPQADVLAQVLIESHAELVTRADFHELTEVVHNLAVAQNRTEQRVEDLAKSQLEMQVSLREMQSSQAAMQESMTTMQESMTTMQESMTTMQSSMATMQWAITDLAKQVGGLSNAVGANLEDFACDLVPELLEKYWRFVTKSTGPEEITTTDNASREFDVVVRGTIDGKPVTVLCETKATVSATEVSKFLRIVEKVRAAHPGEDIRALFFGYKANAAARALITQSQAAMIFTRGVMIPAA